MSTRTVSASELARDTAALLDAVAAGESIVIERRGRAVARLEPPAVAGRAVLGQLRGTAVQRVDDDAIMDPVPGWSPG